MSIVGNGPSSSTNGLTTGDHYIAWQNYASTAIDVISNSGVVSGFPLSNATTWAPFDVWKSSNSASNNSFQIELSVPESVNCFGFYAHNFFSANISVYLQHSDNGSVWSDAAGFGGNQVPNSDGPWIRVTESPVAKKWWRIIFETSGAAPEAGIVFIGNALKLYRAPAVGFVPPVFGQAPAVLNNQARAGGFLGRSVQRQYGETGFEISHVPIEWARNSWRPVLEHVRTLPFFYGWDTDDYPNDTAFCFTDGAIDRPNYSAVEYMRIGLQFAALIE